MRLPASRVASTLRTKLINTTIIIVLVIGSFGVALPMLLPGKASAASSYSNGFATDTYDWSSATRVSGPLTSSDGDGFYAQIPNGAYTRYGGYENIFPASGYTTRADVYLDMTQATGGGTDLRFDYSSAINNTAGSHLRDYVFSLGTDPAVANQWRASFSNNTPGNPSVSGTAITASGWYSLIANFQNTGGTLSVTMSVIRVSDGTTVTSTTLSNPSDIIGTNVGGHRYGWFVNQQAPANTISSINVDNVSLTLNSAVPACNGSSFDTAITGSVNGQEGWMSTGAYDQSVVENVYGHTQFGCKSLRISNATTSGAFGNQTFSPASVNEAGETAATNNAQSGGTRQNHYESEFSIASTQSTYQPGLFMSVSPDRGDGSRMSYLSFTDTPSGISVDFYDVQGTGTPANFVSTNLGTIDYNPHTIKFVIDFVDGPSNDIVKIYIDGVLVHTGTSWENYYRYDNEASAEQTPRTVDSLLFRVSGAAAPANLNKGYLIDGVAVATSTPTPTPPVTPPTNGGNSGSGSTSNTGAATTATTPGTTTTYIAYYDGNGDAVAYDEGEVAITEENVADEGEVKGESTDKSNVSGDDSKNTESQNSSAFLGLGWWWIPIIVVGLGIIYWVVVKRSDSTSSSS